MRLRLSREGVFPIVGGGGVGATGLGVSGTIQGEGKLAGVPSLFVRLQGCNLRCRWVMGDGRVSVCDTAHAWSGEGREVEVGEVYDVLRRNMGGMRHVVITGGEPLMQAEAVGELIGLLRGAGIHSTVESNGIVGGVPGVLPDLLSVSPKLVSSGISDDMRRRSVRGALMLTRSALAEGRDVQVKFVVCRVEDGEEIRRDYGEVLSLLGAEDVIVMPLGAEEGTLAVTRGVALGMAIENGWRYGPRLHIDLFGNREGT